jgi:hypothetical protein
MSKEIALLASDFSETAELWSTVVAVTHQRF